MVNAKSFSLFTLATLLLPAYGAPLTARIAQTIADSTTQWVQACEAAGGAAQCSDISVQAFSTLLAAAGPCDQQNSADQMVDLAKTLNNDPNMIKFAQIFAQQPRNTVRCLSQYRCFVTNACTAHLPSRPILPNRAEQPRVERTFPMPILGSR